MQRLTEIQKKFPNVEKICIATQLRNFYSTESWKPFFGLFTSGGFRWVPDSKMSQLTLRLNSQKFDAWLIVLKTLRKCIALIWELNKSVVLPHEVTWRQTSEKSETPKYGERKQRGTNLWVFSLGSGIERLQGTPKYLHSNAFPSMNWFREGWLPNNVTKL